MNPDNDNGKPIEYILTCCDQPTRTVIDGIYMTSNDSALFGSLGGSLVASVSVEHAFPRALPGGTRRNVTRGTDFIRLPLFWLRCSAPPG